MNTKIGKYFSYLLNENDIADQFERYIWTGRPIIRIMKQLSQEYINDGSLTTSKFKNVFRSDKMEYMSIIK